MGIIHIYFQFSKFGLRGLNGNIGVRSGILFKKIYIDNLKLVVERKKNKNKNKNLKIFI
jgi:hypothetical protein